MRIFYNDINRPRKLAKKLKTILNISLTDSQKHISRISGYKDWNELLVVTNKKEKHLNPDKYEFPINYLQEIFKSNENLASKLIIFFKDNLKYPNLTCEITQEIKTVIKNCNKNIVLGGNTDIPNFVYNNIFTYIQLEHPNNIIFKDTIVKQTNIIMDNKYSIKIHANDLTVLQQRYKQLIEEQQNSLFIYLKMENNKIIYDFKYGYFYKMPDSKLKDIDKTKQFYDMIKNMKRNAQDEIIIGENYDFSSEQPSVDIVNMWNQDNSNIIVSKILQLENTTEHPLWLKHTKIMLNTLLDAMVWLRDKAGYELNTKTVWDNIGHEQMKLIMNGKKYPELPQKYKKGIQNYFDELNNIGTIDSYTSHGFIQHELINVFRNLGLRNWYP